MTRELAGLIALDVGYLVVGVVLLARLGLGPRLRHSGLALVVGWAAFGVVASAALMLGSSLGGWRLVALLLATGVIASVVPLPRAASTAAFVPVVETGRWHLAGLALAGLVGVYGVTLLAHALVAPTDSNWDSWAFWLPKAQAIFYFGGLDTGPGGFTSFANPEYPPLAPATEAAAFHAMGVVEPLALPLQHWILAAAFVTAIAALLAPRVPALLVWPFLAMLTLAPGVGRYLLSSLADPQVAYLIALGGATAALWLLERRPAYVFLSGLFLVAAALTKTEGFLLAAVVPIALLLAAPRELHRQWRPLIGLLAAPALALASWKLWLAAHDQPLSSTLYDFRDALRPIYLVERSDRMSYAIGELLRLVLAPDRWLLVVPAALASAALAVPTQRRLSIFVLAWLVIAFLGLAAVYWIATVDVAWYVDTSAERVVISIAFFAGTLTPLLAAEAFRKGSA